MDANQPRWIRVGRSADISARAAGHSAARVAVDGSDPRLLVVFASFSRYGDSLAELVEGVADVAGEVPVIGCSVMAEIGPGPIGEPGVVVVGFGGDFAVTVGWAGGLDSRPRGVGEEVASTLIPLPDRAHHVALLLTDSLGGDQQEMIRGAYGVLGAAVPLVGGGAGDDMRMLTSRQIFGRTILRNAVVAACIGSAGPIGLALEHGWRSHGEPMMVTASSDNAVYALDDQPALDQYLARHAAPPGIESDPATFGAFALTRPLAVGRRGDVAVRHVLGADVDNRGLTCAGPVPRGASVWLAAGDVGSMLAAAESACATAVGALDGYPPLALLVFDCVGRRALLGEAGLEAERDLMRRYAGTAPLGGFYSYGEIARLRGTTGFHNQTIVAVAVS